MDDDANSNDLPTRIDHFRVPVLAQAVSLSAGGLREVVLVASCDSLEDLAQRLHPFLDDAQLVVPAHPGLTIGDERALRICLRSPGTPPVFQAVCGAIEPVGDAGHVRLQLLGNQGNNDGSNELLERMALLQKGARGRRLDRQALASLSQLLRPYEPTGTMKATVEATAILESSDLEELHPTGRRLPPPPPAPRNPRRESVLARIDGATVRPTYVDVVAPPRPVPTPTTPLPSLRRLTKEPPAVPTPGYITFALVLGLGTGLGLWQASRLVADFGPAAVNAVVAELAPSDP